MEGSVSSSDNQSPESSSKSPNYETPALFVVGKRSASLPPRKLHAASRHTAPSGAVSKPKTSKHASGNRKSNVPVPRTVPLAFPAASSFTFSIVDPASKIATSAKGKAPARAIQVLPTDVLITVTQALELKYHRPLLVSLSLVSRNLNAAVAPLLYRHFYLPSLPDVYEFSRGPRHPSCISSLEMNLSPDPRRRDWTSPDPSWIEGLVCTLRKLERLISLGVKRSGHDPTLQFLVDLAKDTSFLPALQALSLGSWHQLSSLCPGRPITRYDVVFGLHETSAYEKLEELLINLGTSSETIRELKITFDVSPLKERPTIMDYHRDVLRLIGKHMPGLRVLKLRFQCRNGGVDIATDLPALVKQVPALKQLVFLEFFDSHFPQFASSSTVAAATELVQEGGPCPNLKFVNFDGLPWKHTIRPETPPLLPDLPLQLRLASLSLENGKADGIQSELLAPLMPWTPSPSSKRGRKWWERRVPKLRASSHAQAVSLLWHWMAAHWGRGYMADITSLERTVTRWK